MKNGGKKKGKAWGRIRALFGVLGSGILKVSVFLLVITAVSLCFLSLYHYLLGSPYMRLEQVDIEGVDPKMREELIQEYGLDRGPGLLSLRLDELKREMESHPWIRSVRLERRLPHTLLVEVEREVPVALVRTDDLYYVNHSGEMFKKVSAADDMDLPVITGPSMEGSQLREDLSKAIHVVTVLSSQEQPWSVAELSEIHFRKDGAISLYFNHMHAEVTFMGNELAAKMKALKKVADQLNQSGKMHLVTRINLNYVDGAAVSFSNS